MSSSTSCGRDLFEQPRKPCAGAAQLAIETWLPLANFARLEQQCAELTGGFGPFHPAYQCGDARCRASVGVAKK
jgi:hypothetical protein